MGGAHSRDGHVGAEVDLRRIAENLRVIEAAAGRPVDVVASIKANAYGHGAVPVANALAAHGVRGLATGSIEQAVAVRASGVTMPILIFPGWLEDAAGPLVEHGLTPIVDRLGNAEALSLASVSEVRVWVKVDAGLGRHGVPLEVALAFVRELNELPSIQVEGVMTHLPFVDEAGLTWAQQRLELFGGLVEELRRELGPIESQALSSAGVLAGLEDRSSAICPGHAMYGMAPAAPGLVDMSRLRPALLTIRARLAQVSGHDEPRRAGVGGGLTLGAGAVTGVASIGRNHGYRLTSQAGAAMLVRGRRAPVLGLSLEHALLDLRGVDGAAVGDEVIVLGRSGDETITLEDLASWQGLGQTDALLSFDGHVPFDYRS
ncbi:MAG: alanine racemase [Gaiellales bacterium]